MFGCGQVRHSIPLQERALITREKYPAYDAFLANVELEAEQNVRRLRHHPSVVIFAGNNEGQALVSCTSKERHMTLSRLPARRAVEPGPRLRRRRVGLSEEQLSRSPHLRACFTSDRQGTLGRSLPPRLSLQWSREGNDRPDVRRFAPMERLAWFTGAVAQLGHTCRAIRFRIRDVRLAQLRL
jgi:hypothetical protein